jgi:hypothetical protein
MMSRVKARAADRLGFMQKGAYYFFLTEIALVERVPLPHLCIGCRNDVLIGA